MILSKVASMKKKISGFTLVEMIVAVAIIAVLTTIATLSYQKSVITHNRAEAKAVLISLTQDLDRYYLVNNTYEGFSIPTNKTQWPATGLAQYVFDTAFDSKADDDTATLYKLEAQPASSTQKKDTHCGSLFIDQAGTKTTSTGATDCW